MGYDRGDELAAGLRQQQTLRVVKRLLNGCCSEATCSEKAATVIGGPSPKALCRRHAEMFQSDRQWQLLKDEVAAQRARR